ncbi:MAG: SHOCT domain-containing protein [Clostridia bacterium]|nr:SHOCT domain-containing protein [Clostridia bacterium]
MNINKELIIKNISAILCAIAVIGLVFTFATVDVTAGASIMGVSAEATETVTANGLEVLTGSGVWGYLIILGFAAVLLANYLKQLTDYKNLLSLAGSIIAVISTIMSAKKWASLQSLSTDAGVASVEFETSYGLGFWIILIAGVALVGIAMIGYFNLKGNPVFDAINNDTDTAQGVVMPSINLDAVSEKIDNTAKNVVSAVNKDNTQPPAAPSSVDSSSAASTPSVSVEQDNSDAIMEKINKLFEMKERGVLSEEEFAEQKSALLKQMM